QPCGGNVALAPISLARAVLQETKRELQKMEEKEQQKNAMLEQLMMVTAPGGLVQCPHCLGDMAETTGSLQEEQEEGSADCSKCTFKTRVLLGKLFKRCEKLQEQVDSLESRQMAVGKLETMMRNWAQQDMERLQHVEATVVQIQGDCEKLSLVSGSLQEDSQQKQKAIEV
ncbi:QRIC2 protein, partial [Anthoscopus minutus]|nr:QRIC2 protein [Anthoscopus minutus]